MRAVELFGCSGGMAEGFRRAAITFDFSFDLDPDACASYATNLGQAPVQIDVKDLLRMVRGGWSPGPLDLLVADPPCTPWSRAGKRGGLDDERDLLEETAELIALLQPRAYLIANVPGLDDTPHLPVVQRVIGGLGKHGYCVGDFARLDAADYGVPQHRVRPFWFGHRGGRCLTWPVRTHGPAEAEQLTCIEPLRPWVTCRDALGHLPIEQLGRPVRLRWKAYDVTKGGHRPSAVDKPARALTRNANGDGALVAHPKHPIAHPDAPAPTMTDEPRGAMGAGALVWPWDRPSTAITEDARIPPPGHHPEAGSILSTSDAILLSEQAKAILQVLAPSWAILRPAIAARREAQAWIKIGNDNAAVAIECAAWDVYEPAYLAEMRTSYVRHRARWDALLHRERVVLLCFCPMRLHCHRGLLAERILPTLGAIDCGELAA